MPSTPPNWGKTPWTISFRPKRKRLPSQVDFAIVGAGFSGFPPEAHPNRLASKKSVIVLESGSLGAGSSGYTGGMALAESAAGPLPGLGDVLAGYKKIYRDFRISAELNLPGVWELARGKYSMEGKEVHPLRNSPIDWSDSGRLRTVSKVPGGTVNPGKVISGLARAAEKSGASIFERTNVLRLQPGTPLKLIVNHNGKKTTFEVHRVLLATNAASLELTALERSAKAHLTFALCTEPLKRSQLKALGLFTKTFLNRGLYLSLGPPYPKQFRNLRRWIGHFKKLARPPSPERPRRPTRRPPPLARRPRPQSSSHTKKRPHHASLGRPHPLHSKNAPHLSPPSQITQHHHPRRLQRPRRSPLRLSRQMGSPIPLGQTRPPQLVSASKIFQAHRALNGSLPLCAASDLSCSQALTETKTLKSPNLNGMRSYSLVLIIFSAAASLFSSVGRQEQQTNPDDEMLLSLKSHQYDLRSNGRDFLLNESRKSEFFLLGELLGDNEIPAFLKDVWPERWKQGYRHIAAEISPWTAHQLESVPLRRDRKSEGFGQKTKQSVFIASLLPTPMFSGVVTFRKNSRSFLFDN
jgi:hypothetical protein